MSLPHSPGEGVHRAGSGPGGWTNGPGGRLRGRRRHAPIATGSERLYSFLTWWGCSGQGCYEVRDGLLWLWFELMYEHHVICFKNPAYFIFYYCWFIHDDLSPSAGMASHFWVLKAKPWKFSTGTMMLKCKSAVTDGLIFYSVHICNTFWATGFISIFILWIPKVWTASRVELWPSEKANECNSQIQIRWAMTVWFIVLTMI